MTRRSILPFACLLPVLSLSVIWRLARERPKTKRVMAGDIITADWINQLLARVDALEEVV